MQPAAAHEPIAQGSLTETPLTHLLLYFEQRASSGTLVLSPNHSDERRYGLRIRDGRVAGALLGSHELGLEAALVPLCGIRDGIFAFYADDLLPNDDSVMRGTVDPYRLLAAALAGDDQDDQVAAVLERYAGVRMRLQPKRDLKRLRLDGDQSVLLDVLRASPATPESLVEDAPLSPQKARRTVYLLIVTRTIEPFDESEDPRARSHSRLSIPIAQDTTASSTVRRKGSIPVAEPPQAQSLPPAQGTTIRSSRPGIPTPTSVSRPPAAWKVLAARQAASIPPARAVDAATAELARIEKLVRSSDLIAADTAIDRLLVDNPQHARAIGTKAWIMLLKALKGHTAVPREVVVLIKRALTLEPEDARALLTKGLYYKQQDKLPQALVCFKKAARADPLDIDAKREAHLVRRQLGLTD